MVAEEQHNRGPRQRSERGPGIVVDARVPGLARDDGQAVAGLNGNAREGQDNARKDVDNDLLVDRRDAAGALRTSAEDEVTTEQSGKEGVVWACRKRRRLAYTTRVYLWERIRRSKLTLFSWRRAVVLQCQHGQLVDSREACEVAGMVSRRSQY